jgi:hypothetical protein
MLANMRLRLVELCVLSACIAHPLLAQPIPSINVTERFRVFSDPDGPGREGALAIFEWKTTNATEVWILGDQRIEKAQPNGKLEAHRTGGAYLFVAFGPGGSASQYTVASLSAKPGPGRHGVVYNLSREFTKNGLLEDSFKHVLASSKPESQLINITLDVLQRRGRHTVDTTHVTAAGSGALLYTKDFESDTTLRQTPQQESSEGQIERQIAFVVWLTRIANQWWVYILPMVKQNHPRDNSKWKTDPDMLLLGRPAATAVFDEIQAAAR